MDMWECKKDLKLYICSIAWRLFLPSLIHGGMDGAGTLLMALASTFILCLCCRGFRGNIFLCYTPGAMNYFLTDGWLTNTLLNL